MAKPSSAIGVTLHTPRLDARRKALATLFSVGALSRAWKDYVRPGMRKQDISDLFDYNDFHWNRADHFQYLNQTIVEGRYRPNRSIASRVEKRLGVSRTTITPTPEDAVVLQCIVEGLLPKAIKARPSTNAFFSRSHSDADAEFTFGKDYIWFKQWPKFFKKRLSISTTHDWVVTTDVANFFDNVHHSHLRNIISTFDGIEEVVLDLLFGIVSEISWNPDYLPSSGIGLPQVDFDAPRLLAHIYLFEIDSFLKQETANHFVRWVDDITFAVPSRAAGKRILRDLDALMQLRGVRLNAGKTRVLSTKEARSYFYGAENEYLDKMRDKVNTAIKAKKATKGLTRHLAARFEKHLSQKTDGHHDKVTKRYVGLFSVLKSTAALRHCLDTLPSDPSGRETTYRYLIDLGPSRQAFRKVEGFLVGENALDDIVPMQIARMLTNWEVEPKTALFSAIRKLGTRLASDEFLNRSMSYFVAALWIGCKYGRQTDLRNLLSEWEPVWSNSEFLSRQVAAATGKFRLATHRRWAHSLIERHGFRSAVSVVSEIRHLGEIGKLPQDLRMYILNGRNRSGYSIQRFLILFQVLLSKNMTSADRIVLRDEALKYVSDPHYRAVLLKL